MVDLAERERLKRDSLTISPHTSGRNALKRGYGMGRPRG